MSSYEYDSWECDDSLESQESSEDCLEEFEKDEEEKPQEPFEAIYRFHVDNWKEKCKYKNIVSIPFFHEGMKFFVKIDPQKEISDENSSSFETSLYVGLEEFDIPVFSQNEYIHFNLEIVFLENDIKKQKNDFFINIRNPNAEMKFILSSSFYKMERFDFELSLAVFTSLIN
jgi:hypothetical protein